MTIFRYSARAANYDRRGLFPVVMGGLLGLWALAALAMSCGPKLADMDVPAAKAFVSCEPANNEAASGLLRCTIAPADTGAREI